MLSKLREYMNYDSPVFRFFGFLSPDTWSFLTLVCSAFAGWYYHQGNFWVGGLFVLLSGITDTLDGGVARHLGKGTPFGAILDATMDRLGEGLIFAGLIQQFPIAIFALIFSYMVSYVRAKDDRVRVGIAERNDRAAALVLASLFGFVEAGLWLITAAAAITVAMRLHQAKRLMQ